MKSVVNFIDFMIARSSWKIFSDILMIPTSKFFSNFYYIYVSVLVQKLAICNNEVETERITELYSWNWITKMTNAIEIAILWSYENTTILISCEQWETQGMRWQIRSKLNLGLMQK